MKKGISILFCILIGIMIGLYIPVDMHQKPTVQKKPLYWVAPMNPSYKRDKPGKSPMGMDLVPVYADEGNSTNQKGFKINPVVQNNISIALAKAVKKDLSRKINTVGFVSVDENKIEKVHTYVDGWIRNLKITSNGVSVRKGELLFKLFSPTLINAQQEYLLALKSSSSLLNASEKKLKTLGFSTSQIMQLKRERRARETIKIIANANGIIANLSIRDGVYIKPDKELMAIEDLSTIWIDAEVYDKDSPILKIGQMATAKFKAYPGKEWYGEVGFIYPTLNLKTRTIKVRLVFPNPTLALKPNMFADVNLFTTPKKDVLVIPLSSIIQTENMNRVIKVSDTGAFIAQEVQLGIESGDEVEVTRGLNNGEKIVNSSQFLIDSESNVQSSIKRITSNKEEKNIERAIYGVGKILSINNKDHELTLDHKPIPSINMPSMVMKFTVSDKINLDKFSTNETVQFELIKTKEDKYLISFIRHLKEK